MEDKIRAQMLEEEMHLIKEKYKSELKEKNDKIKELNNLLKVKGRVERVTHAEYTTKYFPNFMLKMIKIFDPSGRISKWYLDFMSIINYAIVCGIGVIINQLAIHTLIKFMSLFWANSFAILIAFIWNWNFSVGPLGFLFGLSPRKKKVKN